jgi:hypothetical protein
MKYYWRNSTGLLSSKKMSTSLVLWGISILDSITLLYNFDEYSRNTNPTPSLLVLKLLR